MQACHGSRADPIAAALLYRYRHDSVVFYVAAFNDMQSVSFSRMPLSDGHKTYVGAFVGKQDSAPAIETRQKRAVLPTLLVRTDSLYQYAMLPVSVIRKHSTHFIALKVVGTQ